MTFDHDFGFYSPFLLPPKKLGKRKKNELSKITIKSHAFLLDHSDEQYEVKPMFSTIKYKIS